MAGLEGKMLKQNIAEGVEKVNEAPSEEKRTEAKTNH